MKRYGKVFIMSLLSIFALSVPVFAREMTPQELGEKAKEQVPNTSYVYVIGDYAFTSEHTLTTQDVMLAARSINAQDKNGKTNEDDIYNEMTIFTVEGDFDEDSGDFKGWIKGNNVIGTSQLGDNLNIHYIDYNYLKDVFTVEFDLGGGKFADGKTSIEVDEGEKINKADITGANRPTLKGKEFKEWVKEDGVTPWNFEDTVTGNMKLKATWYEEVDTDQLLEDSISEIKSTDYSVTFENGKLTYNLYDINKKNSEIKGTGLVGIIRDILKIENVKNLTVSYEGTDFIFDNSEMNGEQSEAYKKLQELLAKVSGKSFNEMVQGDLVGKELTLTITLNEEKARSQNNNVEEKYTIEFSYTAPATVVMPSKDEDFNDFNYTLPNNTYKINGKDGLYTVTGYVTEQEGVKGFGDKTTGFYFAYTIKLDDGIDVNKAKVKVPIDKTGTKYNEANFDTTTKTVTVLMEVEESEVGEEAINGYRDIIVDIDGVPTKIRINFEKLELKKNSKFGVEDAKDENKLNENYGWIAPKDYNVEYTTDGDTVKLKGLLPIFDNAVEKLPFEKGHDTGYYIAFAIKTKNKKEDDTVVNIKDAEETFSWTSKDFDDEQTIYILKHLHPDNEYKTFTIEVDMDGEGTKYNSYKIIVDWSELHFQHKSDKTEIKVVASEEDTTDITESDKEQITKQWGYDFKNAGKNIAVKKATESTVAYKLSGKVKEQALKSAAGFGTEKGYYIVLKINGPTEEELSSTPYVDTNKWTVQLKDTEGNYKQAVHPSEDDYKNGFITALIKLDDKPGNKKITYMIDWDGEDNDYLPYEETIDYSDLEFLSSHTITIDDGTETEDIVMLVWDEDVITTDILPEEPKVDENEKDYRSFAYWDEGNGTEFETETISKETKDIKIVPHWNLYSDKFVSDVIEDLNKTENSQSEDFSDEFVIEDYKENSGKVTITVKDPTTPLSRMNETSIPGTIAYILLKDEIKEITLSINGQEKTFTKGDATDQDKLKAKVIQDVQNLYTDSISAQFGGKDENTVTLSDVAHKAGYSSFTLKINPESLPKTITLTKAPEESGLSVASVVDVPNEYEFTFESDAIIVNSEEELNNALKTKAEHIYIGQDFTVNKPGNIEREVVINGGHDHHKLTASSGDTIFNVQSPNVTIDAIKLDAKTPIVVASGSLTSTRLTVEGNTAETAVEVKDGATLTISELTFNGEKYDKPAVKAEKENAKVNFTDSTSKSATKLEEIEKITKYENQIDEKSSTGDKKEVDKEYNYHNYYNKTENSKIYTTTFHNHEARLMATFYRYNYYGDKVQPPYSNEPFKVFKEFNYDGETYTLIGFARSRDKTIHLNYTGDSLPEGVIGAETIIANSDERYYAAYGVKPQEGAEKVSNAEEFKAALDKPNVDKIYITTGNLIDLTDQDITISRKLSIVGLPTGANLKVKSINITAEDVFLHRLNFKFEPESDKDALISTSESKLTLWQCSLKNIGSQKVNNAIKYTGTTAIVDVRWNTFWADNINNTFVNVDSALAEVTDIYGNTFKKLTGEDSKKSAITIKKFDTTAQINGDDETIRISANTFDDSDYAIEISKEASSGNQADISLETSKNIEIAVKYDTSNKDFKNIKLHCSKDKDKITIIYIDSDNGATSNTLDGGEEVSIVLPMEMQGIKVPEQAVIKGLKLNGDTYSGVISQSEDGKFYLPVALTSNDFEDRVSTVKVTDPNGNVKTYLYSSSSKDGIATVSNANTMNLQLEAIKSSKITGANGKIYKLELDADGEKSDAYEVKEYTINYGEVETLEEKINIAAQNMLNVNSFTVKKNNKINGYTEEFTYQYNKEQGLTHLKADKDNVEEYTFSLKYAGIEDDSRTSSIVVEKSTANAEDGKVYINDWVYVHPQKVGRAIHEVTMLTDVMGETSINAIDKVEAVEGKEHAYKVTLSRDKYNDWVKNNYLSNSKYSSAEWALNETVTVDVVLDDTEQYITSIKTNQKSSVNTFDVTFEKVNETNIAVPTEFLAEEGETLKDEDIKNFYESGKKWWEKHIYENAYKQ